MKDILICVDYSAPSQAQLRQIQPQNGECTFKTQTLEQVIEAAKQKLMTLSDQSSYLDVLIEVQNCLEQDAQKFEFSSKISQLKSCMKKATNMIAFLEKNKDNSQIILSKIQESFQLVDENNELCLLEEKEINRKMNRKYEKLIQKHLAQYKKVQSNILSAQQEAVFLEISQMNGLIILDKSNSKLADQFSRNQFCLDPLIFCAQNSLSTIECQALGSGFAKNTAITNLSLNLFGQGITSNRLESIALGLARNKSIKKIDLNLGGNMLNQSDIGLINEIFIQNSTLETLNLNLKYNHIQGGGIKDLGYGISRNQGLKSIEIETSENDISKRGIKQFSQFIKDKKDIVSINFNKGTESEQYKIFVNYHLCRIANILEVIVKSQHNISELLL